MAASSGSRGLVLNSPDMGSGPRSSSPRSRLSSPVVAAGAGSSRSSPAPASPGPTIAGLLIPTDRTIVELEERWLPKLGSLHVEREVVLPGYALYGVRSWYLSRTHWSHTIVTPTGKPTETISAYLLQPERSLGDRAGEKQLAQAIAYLTAENKSSVRKTEYGTLLVNAPAMFGQDVTAIPGGDLRRAKPFIIVNTALRRLGCGGRAAMTLEPPIPTLRRKLHELYKLPVPTAPPSSNNNSQPPQSPVSPSRQRWGGSPIRGDALADPAAQSQATDPFTIITTELVSLVQAALALWGVYGANGEEAILDGLFCDDTKAGIFAWRRAMGMEHEESLKLEKETSGGCIDPRTLSVLFSSVTSTRYHLAILNGEKVPKDPFSHIKRFLQAWHTYQVELGRYSNRSEYLSVASIRSLITDFKLERKRSGTDALKMPRLLLSGVASATSSISANLRGGGTEDTPLRMREHHHAHFRDDAPDEQFGSGVGLITADDQVGSSAAPNIITTDLEAYISGILHSRQKDWDAMGARRIAELWSGRVGTDAQNPRRTGSRQVSRSGTLVKPNHGARVASRDFAKEEEGDDSVGGGGHGAVRSALKGMAGKTEQVFSRGLGIVTRRGTVYETSDSEPGPGPSSLRNSASARGRMSVPTVMEPDVMEEEDLHRARFSASPSPSGYTQREANGSVRTRPSFLATSRQGSDVRSKRPSIITSLSYDGSDTMSRRSRQSSTVDVSALATQSLASGPAMARSSRIHGRRSPLEERWEADRAEHSDIEQGAKFIVPRTAPERALAWRERGRATTMLRTASDGADVVVEEGGMEWEVVEPHGTGKRQHQEQAGQSGSYTEPGRMRRSQSDTALYTHTFRPIDPEYLQIDVELCVAVCELRERMALLTQRADDLKMLENSIFRASAQLIDTHQNRRGEVAAVTEASAALIEQLERYVDDIETDPRLMYYRGKMGFNELETDHRESLAFDLGRLHAEWSDVREENERRRHEAELDEEPKSWWKLW